jgi:hypothetical protein
VLDLSRGQESITKALSHCVMKHPILSAVIVDGHTEKPTFALLDKLDLSRHVDIRVSGSDLPEHERIEQILAVVSDEQFPLVDEHPSWKIVLMPLPARDGAAIRLLVLFAYYHSHGDGKAGLAFHRTFFERLQDGNVSEQSDKVFSIRLPPPMEEAGKLSLSWSYLLSPLLGAYLPSFLATMLGVRASAVAQENGVWCGEDLSFDPNNFRTGLTMVIIDHSTLRNALQRCKARQTSFTGLLNQLIARALHAELGPHHTSKVFASQIVVDLRHLFQGAFSNESMTNCVSAYNGTVTSPSIADEDWTSSSSDIWIAARNTTTELANCAGTLHNQPIGLLQYLKDFRPWTLSQIGKKREGSYEISNLVVFDPVLHFAEPSKSAPDTVQIERTIFSQPANAAGACLNFNLVTTKGGPLVMTATWQQGVLDVGDADAAREADFVRRVCSRLETDISELATAPL